MADTGQVGGEHYKTPVQHWDWAQYLPYLEGCATKYFGRHFSKNGIEDIKKGLTFVAKICRQTYGFHLEWSLTKIEPECDYNVND